LQLVEDIELWCGNRLSRSCRDQKSRVREHPLRLRDREIYFGGHRRHESLGIIAFRAFESSGIETWAFRLDDPQKHHCAAFGAPRTLYPVCEHFIGVHELRMFHDV
jgi:hypothetical protein